MKHIILVLIFTTFLNGCANQPADPNAKTDAEIAMSVIESAAIEPVRRIGAFRSGNWNVLDSKHLLLTTNRDESYLVELRNSCTGLGRMNDAVGINRVSSSVLTDSDSLFAPTYPKMKCLIKSIYPLTVEQTKQLQEKLENN